MEPVLTAQVGEGEGEEGCSTSVVVVEVEAEWAVWPERGYWWRTATLAVGSLHSWSQSRSGTVQTVAHTRQTLGPQTEA